MAKVEYRYESGARFRGVAAQVAGRELARIRTENDGKLRPADTVAAARPDDAPLHPIFTWDDKRAAENWRLEEARHLIRAVRIVTKAGDEPAFVHIRVNQMAQEDADEGPYYQSTRVAVKSEDEWTVAVDAALERLSSAEKAVNELKTIASGSPKVAQVTVVLEALAIARAAAEKMAA